MKRHGKESIFILLFFIIMIPTVAIGLIWHNENVGVLSFKEIRTRGMFFFHSLYGKR